MSNEEQILQILQGIAGRLDRLETGQAEIREDLASVKGDVAFLKEDVASLKGDVAFLKEDAAAMKEDLARLNEAHEITRGALNHLLEWSDKVSEAMDFPLPKS